MPELRELAEEIKEMRRDITRLQESVNSFAEMLSEEDETLLAATLKDHKRGKTTSLRDLRA